MKLQPRVFEFWNGRYTNLSADTTGTGPCCGCFPITPGSHREGESFPSARILRKIARPLSLDEHELFALADYLSPQTSAGV